MTIDETTANPARVSRAEVLQAAQAVTSRFGDDYFHMMDKEEAYPHDYVKALMDAKLHTVMIPEEYGGMGLGLQEACVIVEEMHRSGGVGSMIHGQMFMMGILARHGTDEQKRKILEEVCAGRVRLQSFSLTEPDAGTDTAEDDHQGCQGRRRVGHHGPEAVDLALRLHRRLHGVRAHQPSEGSGQAAPGHFGLPGGQAQGGSEAVHQPQDRRDVQPSHVRSLLRRHAGARRALCMGEEGKGFKYLLDGLNAERIIIASEAIGDGRWFVEKAVNYAKERVLFGKPIGANQGVQFPIALGYAHLEAADALRWKAAEKFDRHEPCGGDANIAKMLASDASWELANVCMQTHGGFGLAKEYHIERRFRDTRVFQIAPISPNMVLNYVSQHVLGLPRSY
jgi:acyl-CoA dehydrogenase